VGERAAEKLSNAGRRALARADLPAAVSLLRRASSMLDRSDARRLELLVDLGEALLQQGSFDAASAALAETEQIAGETGMDRFAVQARLGRALTDQYRGSGDASTAIAAAREAIAVLEPLGDAHGLAQA